MATQTVSYVDAITHLPPGGTLILTDVPWEEYEQLLADLGDSYAARITYDRGRLEIIARVVDQDVPHHLRDRGDEVRAVLPSNMLQVIEL